MDKQTFILVTDRVRDNALSAVRDAPAGWRVKVEPPLRSGDQNSKMWAMLNDVARAKPEGRNWSPETWKAAFMTDGISRTSWTSHECLTIGIVIPVMSHS